MRVGVWAMIRFTVTVSVRAEIRGKVRVKAKMRGRVRARPRVGGEVRIS